MASDWPAPIMSGEPPRRVSPAFRACHMSFYSPYSLHLAGALLVCLICFGRGEASAEEEISQLSTADAVKFVQSYCVDCHAGKDAESGLDFSSFESSEAVAKSIDKWNQIATRVSERQMPPQDSELPPDDVRDAFVRWIRSTIFQAVCDDGVSPGRPMIRRMNRTEYANTVRDLLGIPIDAGHALPDDGAGGEGFDNAAETLFISPIYAEKYLQAAKSAIGHALTDPGDRQRIITATPNDQRSPEQAARTVLQDFLPRAFRRPVNEQEIAEYVTLFNRTYEEEASYDAAIEFSLVAAMVSPKFLFLYEQPGQPGEATPVSHYEMASRLSYFLWAAMPDDELTRLASEQKLQDEQVLADQVRRMLKGDVDSRGLRRDAKVRGFASSFIEQWLGTRAIGREFKPDPSIARRYDSELEGGMKYEPIFFFEDLLSENRSLLNLIDADFTYVNRRLAQHYRVDGEFREQPKYVDLDPKDHRGGLLGMSAVLAVSSLPHRTSPVLRGKWILETMLGTPPPPPPPNVPPLEETEQTAQPTSLRQQLELHRSNPTCASCHNVMDPLGFGLENYDVLGQWRTEAGGAPIDAAGTLPSGEGFNGPEELKQLLMERKEQFARNLTRKTLGYALARGLTAEDDCVVETIVRKLAEDDYRAQTMIIEIVKSVPFRYKQDP
jgi:hypothetical protein